MLNLFPNLLFLAPFSATLIRLSVAIILFIAAWWHFKKADAPVWWKTFSGIEGVLAVALFMGFYTQPVALITLVTTSIWGLNKTLRPFPLSTVLLTVVLSLTLIFTGAGPFAFDLPF